MKKNRYSFKGEVMGYKIRRKFSSVADDNYVNSWGEECSSFEAKSFKSREEAEQAKRNITWKLNGFSSDFEVTAY